MRWVQPMVVTDNEPKAKASANLLAEWLGTKVKGQPSGSSSTALASGSTAVQEHDVFGIGMAILAGPARYGQSRLDLIDICRREDLDGMAQAPQDLTAELAPIAFASGAKFLAGDD